MISRPNATAFAEPHHSKESGPVDRSTGPLPYWANDTSGIFDFPLGQGIQGNARRNRMDVFTDIKRRGACAFGRTLSDAPELLPGP